MSVRNNTNGISIAAPEWVGRTKPNYYDVIVTSQIASNEANVEHIAIGNIPDAASEYSGSSAYYNDTDDNGTDVLALSMWTQATWTAVFSIMLIIAIGGNLIVIWIVIAHRRMRSVTNYFLVNLSVADLLMSTLNCLFNFIYMIHKHWSFGEFYCKVNNFLATATVTASVYTLAAISYDRYIAIVYPLQPRMSKRYSLFTIMIVWVTSSIIGSPCFIYSRTYLYRYAGFSRTACVLIWPDGISALSRFDYWYQITFMILTYFVPIALMLCCYFRMSRVLWGSQSIGEMSQRQAESIRSKRKVVKMFIFVVMVFTICWLPYHGFFIYTHLDSSLRHTTYVHHIYLAFYWLAMSNAMVNPLIYYWMNARFRKYFITATCGWRYWFTRREHSNVRTIEMESPGNTARQSDNSDPTRYKEDGFRDNTKIYKVRGWYHRPKKRGRTAGQIPNPASANVQCETCRNFQISNIVNGGNDRDIKSKITRI